MTSRRLSPPGAAASQSSALKTPVRQLSGGARIWSLGPGMAAGLASVVGAGLIAVPAAVLHETGGAAALTWIIAALACLPMLMLFRDTVIVSGHSADPLRETIRAGLGRRPAAMVPLMFSLVVTVGLPSGSEMAARNLAAIMDVDVPETAIAVLLMAFAVVVNLRGRSLGSTVERIGAVVLVVAIVAVIVWSLMHPARVQDAVPDVPELALIPAGALVAFWAFIGFENLTFLARELPDPRRDFAPVAIISLALLSQRRVHGVARDPPGQTRSCRRHDRCGQRSLRHHLHHVHHRLRPDSWAADLERGQSGTHPAHGVVAHLIGASCDLPRRGVRRRRRDRGRPHSTFVCIRSVVGFPAQSANERTAATGTMPTVARLALCQSPAMAPTRASTSSFVVSKAHMRRTMSFSKGQSAKANVCRARAATSAGIRTNTTFDSTL